MTDMIDPYIFEEFRDPNNPETPSFRFSRFFTETKDNVSENSTGVWLKILDTDTINDFVETFYKIDQTEGDDNIKSDDQTRKDMTDLLYLTSLLWEWEENKSWNVNLADDDQHHLHVEYYYRLARLITYEYLQRRGETSKDEILERDEAQYHGKLSIFE